MHRRWCWHSAGGSISCQQIDWLCEMTTPRSPSQSKIWVVRVVGQRWSGSEVPPTAGFDIPEDLREVWWGWGGRKRRRRGRGGTDEGMRGIHSKRLVGGRGSRGLRRILVHRVIHSIPVSVCSVQQNSETYRCTFYTQQKIHTEVWNFQSETMLGMTQFWSPSTTVTVLPI